MPNALIPRQCWSFDGYPYHESRHQRVTTYRCSYLSEKHNRPQRTLCRMKRTVAPCRIKCTITLCKIKCTITPCRIKCTITATIVIEFSKEIQHCDRAFKHSVEVGTVWISFLPLQSFVHDPDVRFIDLCPLCAASLCDCSMISAAASEICLPCRSFPSKDSQLVEPVFSLENDGCSPCPYTAYAVVLTKILSQPLRQNVLFSPYCHQPSLYELANQVRARWQKRAFS